MPLRITDIVNMPELHTRFFAGADGGERTVRWAHVCELPDPSEWLGEGGLLMTTGMGIPAHLGIQESYIEKLAQAGLAGVMIGENMQAPNDLSSLQNAADRLNFPILMTQYGVPFSSVTRIVVEASRREEFDRLNVINRLYVSARMAIEGMSLEQLFQRLEKDIRAELMLVDMCEEKKLWFPKDKDIPENLKAAIKKQPLDFSDTQPIVRRYLLDDGNVYAASVPSRHTCILLARVEADWSLEYSLLQHLVAVLGISIERLYVETERTLRIGSQLLDDLLNFRLSAYDMGKQLEKCKLDVESACLAVARPGKQRLTEWNLQFCRLELPVLLRPQGDELVMLMETGHIAAVQNILNVGVGFSNAIGNYERLFEALREARLASLHTSEIAVVSYADIADRVPWLPHNLDEATQTFHRVLGALADYEEKQGTALLKTLKVFLDQNRSWLAAAKQLHIHKTTLIYRIRKIESLTGRSLDRTEDVTILWLALRAGELAGRFLPPSQEPRESHDQFK
ncbi:PucR family transcriptional regulator [Allopusillimonas soli]|uniref:PucR family transcriptional regulator n=1 Tax=Allopusillimonas soli TaxID=659016 RepID=A0A853FDN1_9BURK|nr:PucR family transcriptional regulator [Allopusillimonas soli]NYT38183.1 PucR family transcriptional regulator [Allopusillimonas soli]TEA74055.1 PucR family transcriptional regulator [Allopusillimonas soli]